MDKDEKIKSDLKTEKSKEETPEPKIETRGRKAGQKNKKTVDKEQLKISLVAFGGTLLDLVNPRLPNPVPFSNEEKNMFGTALGNVAEKYLDAFKYEEEAILLLVTVGVFYPRLKPPEKPKEKIVK